VGGGGRGGGVARGVVEGDETAHKTGEGEGGGVEEADGEGNPMVSSSTGQSFASLRRRKTEKAGRD
jgi:hypothetical protein